MDRKQKVLIVEDEKNIVDILRFNLRKEGYDTLEAFDGVTGLRLALEESPDLILLDLMLPEMNGFEVCKLLRDREEHPVLIITAREEEKDKILGLDLGGRRLYHQTLLHPGTHGQGQGQHPPGGHGRPDGPPGGILGPWPPGDPQGGGPGHQDGENLELTQREFELLTYLASHAGRVFSRQELMEQVWNYEGYVGDVRGVDVAIRRLREKVRGRPRPAQIHHHPPGLGYYFQKDT